MATHTIATPASVLQFQKQSRKSVPQNVVEALNEGWRVLGEKSKSTARYRCGTLTLTKNGRRISVAYFADAQGFYFGSIKAL